MTAQDLKNAILQLAVQGKLVPQDPNDEPASELLKQIKALKERFIKEGKIKREKTLAPIADDEIPFDIPENWEWVKIGYLFTIVRGITFPSEAKKKTPSSDLVPCATTGSVQNHYNSEADVFVSPEYVKRDDQWLLPRDIIMSTANSRELVGKTCIWNESERKTFGGFLTVLRPANCVYPVFAYYALMSIKASGAFLKNATQTTNIANINTQVLSNTIFPLPPLAEQRRIVAKIEELMPLVEKYGKAEERLTTLNDEFPDKLRKSILQQAIQGKLTERDPADEPASELLKRIREEKDRLIKEGKIKKEKPLPPITEEEMPFEIPDGWTWASIGETCANIQYGTSEKSSPKGRIAVLRMGNLQNGRIDYSNLVYSSNEYDIERCHLDYNDLLFNRTNSKELVGKTAIYKAEIPAIYAGYLIRVTPVVLNADFLNYVMQSQYFKDCCLAVKTDAIGQSNINAEKLKRFVFPLPPLAEQQRIVDRVNELLAVCDELK